MARALALIHTPLSVQECLRKVIVLGSALALILAGKPLPF